MAKSVCKMEFRFIHISVTIRGFYLPRAMGEVVPCLFFKAAQQPFRMVERVVLERLEHAQSH
jgi:hypothetical protein